MDIRFSVLELIDFLSAEGVIGEAEQDFHCELRGFSPISDTKEGTISWTKDKDIDFASLRSQVVICPIDTEPQIALNKLLIRVDNPRATFIRIMQRFGAIQTQTGIEDTAVIGKNCVIGNDVYLGHYAVLGNDVTIGDGTVISSHVSIHNGVRIGSRCIIQSNTVIGSDGFGYEKENGTVLKFPHVGGVVIGDDVEIGSNTSIDRGTLGDTMIEDGAKIDNLCHIAHNVRIGKGAFIIACSMIGGSSRIEADSWIAPGAIIRDGISIGQGATVGLGAVVVGDVKAEDVVTGIPARPVTKTER